MQQALHTPQEYNIMAYARCLDELNSQEGASRNLNCNWDGDTFLVLLPNLPHDNLFPSHHSAYAPILIPLKLAAHSRALTHQEG